MQIKNLDAIMADDKQVIIGGKTYTFPGDLPVSMMFRLMEGAGNLEKKPGDAEAIDKSLKLVFDVITIRDKGLTFDEFKGSISMRQYTELSNFIFSITVDEKKSIPDAGAE